MRLAIADANYKLVYGIFRINGPVSDVGIIVQTDFYKKKKNKKPNLKNGDIHLPGLNVSNGLPCIFVGDDAFTLRTEFLMPYMYNVRVLDDKKRVFNYRLSRARTIVEDVFDILVLIRCAVLSSHNRLKSKKINLAVLACGALLNYLRKKCTG
ncbi:hypothetical protein RRG08_044671 [Elysia crispata]|uniref:DDE Tnp4 domain-containing protein n=1 Tax=Elysia crispata TaxID=231223 RepID=A0AAE0Y5Z7_9GAST|nr:hypothetical protein RRG08_044671 [Elysia crispata]